MTEVNSRTQKLFKENGFGLTNRVKTVRKIAFFDIDGTIFRSSLLIELINELVEKRIFPKRAGEEIKAKKIAWLDRVGKYDDYLQKVVEIHLKYIKGCRVEDVRRAVLDVMYFEKDRVYRFTRDLIKKLKKDGYFLAAISGSPIYMVQEFAEYMGFDKAFGQIIGVENKIFTGDIANENFLNKEKTIKEFLGENNIQIDSKNSIAVGDTDNDIPMLKLVGRPIAFNPNRSFAEFAKKAGWEIVVERKDSIYKIKEFEMIDERNSRD